MKNPLFVLAISALATFTMGWVAHRVFSKSFGSETKAESTALAATATPPLKQDSLLTQSDSHSKNTKTVVVDSTSIKDSITAIKHDTSIKMTITVTNVEPEDSVVRKKYVAKASFNDYPVSKKYKGPIPRTLDFSTCGSGKLYQKATKEEVKEGPDFAGQFAFTQVSCGTGCYSSTVVDLKTGKVFAGPKSSNGYSFKVSSSLLIVNPPDSKGYYTDCELCAPELYVWTGKKFKKIS